MVRKESARKQDGSSDIVILTVISAELDAARQVLQINDANRMKDPDGTVYFRGVVRSERAKREYTIALTCIGGPGNPNAAAATASAIKRYSPRAVLLMGIAAGIRGKVQIGEVVLSDRVVAYEPAALSQSASGTKEQPRPEIDRAPHTMIQDVVSYRMEPSRLCEAFVRAGGVVPTAPAGREDEFHIHVANAITARQGTIASGEKLLRDPAKLLAVRELHGKTEVGEMEAAGVVDACRRESVSWLVIRGISDFGDQFKDDRFHAFASCAAAAVLYDFVAHGLDLSTVSSPASQGHPAGIPIAVDDTRRNRERSRLRWSVIGIGAMCLLSSGVTAVMREMSVKSVLGLLGAGVILIALALAFDRITRNQMGSVLKFIVACIVILLLGLTYAYVAMVASRGEHEEPHTSPPVLGGLDGSPALEAVPTDSTIDDVPVDAAVPKSTFIDSAIDATVDVAKRLNTMKNESDKSLHPWCLVEGATGRIDYVGVQGDNIRTGDMGNDDELLVGLNIFDDDVIYAIQPIFALLKRDGSLSGKREGKRLGAQEGGQLVKLEAPPGYLVVSISIKYSNAINQLKITSSPWSKKGLGSHTSQSEWIGKKNEGEPVVLTSPNLKPGLAVNGVYTISGTHLTQISLRWGEPKCTQ